MKYFFSTFSYKEKRQQYFHPFLSKYKIYYLLNNLNTKKKQQIYKRSVL